MSLGANKSSQSVKCIGEKIFMKNEERLPHTVSNINKIQMDQMTAQKSEFLNATH